MLAGVTSGLAKPAEISLAVIQLPEGHDGKIKFKTGAESFQDIQLSTRYFSASIVVEEGTSLSLYNAKDDPTKTPAFIQTRKISEGGRYFGILTIENDKENKGDVAPPVFKLRLIPITNWPQGSIFVVNATSKKLVMEYDEKRQVLGEEATTVIKAENPARSVPIKIAGVDENDKSRLRLIFTSTWRISPIRREFCFFYLHNDRIRLRSLMERVLPKAE